MAEPKNLARFSITPSGENFQLHIEDDGGDTLELLATQDQLDLIADSLDEALENAELDDGEGGEPGDEDEEDN